MKKGCFLPGSGSELGKKWSGSVKQLIRLRNTASTGECFRPMQFFTEEKINRKYNPFLSFQYQIHFYFLRYFIFLLAKHKWFQTWLRAYIAKLYPKNSIGTDLSWHKHLLKSKKRYFYSGFVTCKFTMAGASKWTQWKTSLAVLWVPTILHRNKSPSAMIQLNDPDPFYLFQCRESSWHILLAISGVKN